MEECSATFSATLWEMPRASLCPKPLFPRRCSGTTRLQQAPRGAGGSPQPRSTSIPRIPGKPTASCSPRALRPSSGGAAALFPPPPAHTPGGASARASSSPRRGLRGSAGARRPPPGEGVERPPRLAWPPLPAPHNARRSRPRRFLPPALPTPGSGSLTWLREPGEEVMGGRRRRRQGKEREGGSERAEEGRAWRAGAERRPNWAHGSRRLLTIPGRRAAGRLLLPFSQALGPWGSHGLPACLPRRSASLLPLAERRRLPLASLSSTPGAAGPSSPQPEPGSSHTRSLTSSGERPPGPTAAAPLPARPAALWGRPAPPRCSPQPAAYPASGPASGCPL